MDPAWYWRRLRRTSPGEVLWRARDLAVRQAWRRRQVRPGSPLGTAPGQPPRFSARLPPDVRLHIPADARARLFDAADELLKGRGEVLGVPRDDLADPDWFADPVTGRRAAPDTYAFDVQHRSEDEVGNVKQLWELSRHHHLTVLAAAWFVGGDERYAELAAAQLRSWWQQNPFLSGVHWTSGIEVATRLISWVWIRRLLDGWSGAPGLFEENPEALRQTQWHQEYLAAFRSRGSSANNHVVAEAAGQLVAASAFPWFPKSESWRRAAADLLERELERNTFPSGVNRELASGYHAFTAELALLAAVEATAAGHDVSAATWGRLCRMADVGAAVVDEALRPPRQGDGDDGRTLVVDGPAGEDWRSFLALCATVFGPARWWPPVGGDVRSTLLGAMAGEQRRATGRPTDRPSHFADAGLTLLRTPPGAVPEVWCRCDGGPHGFLSIAAHAHADALSVEVRYGGVDILTDPGTFCYHGQPEWRSYFRSTLGHNTLELAGRDQSRSGGPFLWLRHAGTSVLDASVDDGATVARWSAEHDGYTDLDPPALHRRTVRLDRDLLEVELVDQVVCASSQPCRLAFHLGPAVQVELDGPEARLRWKSASCGGSATMELPAGLAWTAHRGGTQPVVGWYSESFGRKQPSTTLVGRGAWGSASGDMVTRLRFRSPKVDDAPL